MQNGAQLGCFRRSPSGKQAVGSNEEPTLANGQNHVRVDGKFFACSGRPLRLRGVTYGPFAPNAQGEPFPELERVCADCDLMQRVGVNAIRTYYAPPEWFLDVADERQMHILVDVPWSKHLCFLDSAKARQEAREAVRGAVERGLGHPCIAAHSIGNEIPSDVVRWHGERRVERFLRELADVAKQVHPEGLVTYANYPPTEYLDLSFLDFTIFNVYLHDPDEFRGYLFRLQNLSDGKPLVLGELGMDTLRHGEDEQAEFLAGHLREASLVGLAGAFVFSWTDDWYTGGHQIEDWAFGIVRADRSPKPSYQAIGDVFRRSPAELQESTPRVSVVVCSYNGGETLDQCLRSLLDLDYPDYEVILVDDGSTDNTREIVARFPDVEVVHQANQGLSVARNVGLRASTGSIVAYTDSDCFAHPDWLSHLVDQLQRSGAAAVGGPNLPPGDGWLAACIDASPGQPTHVLEGDQVAEHIPGCNMAFRRDALEAIHGFDQEYRKAGDDVDVCWRLQETGWWITFAPSAFVWHHRRATPSKYLRQQAGYGEAEALLRFKHPHKYNRRGEGKWRGVMYGAGLQGLRIGRPVVHRGIFGSGLFQCVYRPAPAHWAMLPSTLEWHLAAVLAALAGAFWPPALAGFGIMLGLSLTVAVLQAASARLAPEHDGCRARLLVGALCYAQPLVRSWVRIRTRLRSSCAPCRDPDKPRDRSQAVPFMGVLTTEYWSEEWAERTKLLDRFVADLVNTHGGIVVACGCPSCLVVVGPRGIGVDGRVFRVLADQDVEIIDDGFGRLWMWG